jgi:predicted NBD/HSP70 family sugar kinase
VKRRKVLIRPIDAILACEQPEPDELGGYEGWIEPNGSSVAFGEQCGGVVGLSAEREALSWVVCGPHGIIHHDRIEAPIAPVDTGPLPLERFRELLAAALRNAADHLPAGRLAGVGMAWPGAIGVDGEPVDCEVHHADFSDPQTGDALPLTPVVAAAVADAGMDGASAGAEPPAVTLVNDADADLLYEVRHGSGAAARNVMAVKVCGGLGMSLMHEGDIVSGHFGRAGEVQHIRVRFEDFEFEEGSRTNTADLSALPECICGGANCVARFATGKALIDQLPTYHSRGQSYTERGRAIERNATNGDVTAVFERTGRLLGQALIGPVLAFDPERVVVSAFPRIEALVGGLQNALTVGTGVSLSARSIDFGAGGDGMTAAGAARVVIEQSVIPRIEREVVPPSTLNRTHLPARLRRKISDDDDIDRLARPYREAPAST